MRHLKPETDPLSHWTPMTPATPPEAVAPEPDAPFSALGVGVYDGLPDGDYRQDPATGHSDIRHWIRPKKLNRQAVVVGRAVHALWLEGPEAFRDRFVTTTENPDLRTREGKARMAELVGDSGKELLRGKEWDLTIRCVGAILKAPGENELAVIGRFPDFQHTYKCRLDLKRRASIWDLKTTQHVNEQDFRKAEVEYGYINQLEWYASLYAAVAGKWLPPGCICVSKEAPHNVWVRYPHQIPNQLMAMATKWRKDMLTLYERYVPPEIRQAAQQHGKRSSS